MYRYKINFYRCILGRIFSRKIQILQMQSLYVIVLSGVMAIVGTVVAFILGKKKTKTEIENMVIDQYDKLIARLNEERKDLEGRQKRNDTMLHDLEELAERNHHKIRTLQQDNEECQYNHEVTELELKQIKKFISSKHIIKEEVYVLDDDKDTLDDFNRKFERISILQFRGFTNATEFIQQAREFKPTILVIDYRIDHLTAEEVLLEINYEPKIFIMSGVKVNTLKFKNEVLRFFIKDDNYILKIAKEIINYLLTKN